MGLFDIFKKRSKEKKIVPKELKVIDPEGYRLLKGQDKQIEAVQAADEKYAEDKDYQLLGGNMEGWWSQI